METLTISNQPLHVSDTFAHQDGYNPAVHTVILSRNVLRDPLNYIRLTVKEGHLVYSEDDVAQCLHKTSTVVIRSKELLRQLLSTKIITIYDNKSDEFVFWSYSQDDNEGIHVKDMLYETDEEELETTEMDHMEKLFKIAFSMMEHTVPVCSKCNHIHNDRPDVDNDISQILMTMSSTKL
jgi:hypothetical protein